jgi:TetR/AcrR family acrAB operon transcriptional repressor
MSSQERILDAAMEVFARYGYRRASMDQVAEAAGLTRQAVYHHFQSKEALFRAAVEALHDGALEAAIAAGAAAEQAGQSLADVLAAQVDAKTRYVVECMEETAHMEELLSQRQLQAGDLNQRVHEQLIALEVETMERIMKQRSLALRDGLTVAGLARSIQFAIRGDNELKLDVAMLDEVARVVRLIVLGALKPKDLTSRPVKKSPASREGRSRKSRSSR